MKKQTYTFLELLKDFKVIIPIIQRDYAHGRDNARAEDVRTMLVKDLWDAVKQGSDGDRSLHLDFVYGRIETNQDGACLIPFDGQQRLTTLFLFHRYLYEKAGVWENSKVQDLLKKFSYATRPSARDFCEALCKENIMRYMDNISDAPWFDVSWLDDPTVKSMLRVLHTIHEKASDDNNYERLYRITFTLADMGQLNMGDMSYISMNSTGRPLTAWENFKASYLQFLLTKDEETTKTDEKINTIWTDFFFKKSREKGETNTGSFDHLMMEMVQLYLFNHQEFEYEKEHILEEKLEIPYPDSKHEKYIPLSSYKKVLDKHKLTPLFNFWDYLHENREKQEALQSWEPIWFRAKEKYKTRVWEAEKFSHKERVAFHACILLFHDSSEISPSLLGEWMRIIWNILENSKVDSIDTYKTYIKLVEDLHEKIFAKEGSKVDSDKKLLEHISDITPSDFSAAPEQLEEEKGKAKLILDGDEQTRENIIKAEKHPWCKGKISVLLNAAKENKEELSVVYDRLEKIKELVTSSETRVDSLKQTVDLLLRYHNSIADKLWESEIAFPMKSDEQWKDEINKHPELLCKIWHKQVPKNEPSTLQNAIDSIYQKHQNIRTLALSHKQIFSRYVRFWLSYDGFRIATKPSCHYQNCYYMDAYGELEVLCTGEISIGWVQRGQFDITKTAYGAFKITKKSANGNSEVPKIICSECLKKLEGDTFIEKLESLFKQPADTQTGDVTSTPQ